MLTWIEHEGILDGKIDSLPKTRKQIVKPATTGKTNVWGVPNKLGGQNDASTSSNFHEELKSFEKTPGWVGALFVMVHVLTSQAAIQNVGT